MSKPSAITQIDDRRIFGCHFDANLMPFDAMRCNANLRMNRNRIDQYFCKDGAAQSVALKRCMRHEQCSALSNFWWSFRCCGAGTLPRIDRSTSWARGPAFVSRGDPDQLKILLWMFLDWRCRTKLSSFGFDRRRMMIRGIRSDQRSWHHSCVWSWSCHNTTMRRQDCDQRISMIFEWKIVICDFYSWMMAVLITHKVCLRQWAHKDSIKLHSWVWDTVSARRKFFCQRMLDGLKDNSDFISFLDTDLATSSVELPRFWQNDGNQSHDQISDGLEYSITRLEHRAHECGEALHW